MNNKMFTFFNFMKLKQLLTTLVMCILFAFNGYSQDTVFLNGTNKVTFSLGFTVSTYWVNCTNSYAPASTTQRSLSSIGKFLVKSNGTGYIVPKAGYSGTWKFYSPSCGLLERTVVFMTAPPSGGGGGGGGGGGSTPAVFSYSWKGSIGNTSTLDYGPTKLKGLRSPTGLTEFNGYLYFTTGLSEGNSPMTKVSLSNLTQRIEVAPMTGFVFEGVDIKSYGDKYYMLGFDPYGYQDNSGYSSQIDAAIVVYDANDNQVTMAAGVNKKCTYSDEAYISLIALSTGDTSQRALKLEVDASYLYVYTRTHIKRYNRTTGAYVDQSVRGTTKYISWYVRNGDSLKMNGTNVKLNNTVICSNLTSPSVNNYTYSHYDFNTRAVKGGVHIGSDGTLWVIDAGNGRILHYTSGGTYLNQIAYIPMNYNCSVDRNNPTRVFAGPLEFQVSYPALTWTLVNNWSYNINAAYLPSEQITSFLRHVVTVGGITYGIVDSTKQETGYMARFPCKMQLTAAGLKRVKAFDIYENVWLATNGDEYRADCNNNLGDINRLYKNNVLVESSPAITNTSASYISDAGFVVTDSGYYVTYTNDKWVNTNYHLQWIKNGSIVYSRAMSTVTNTYPTTQDQFVIYDNGGLPSSLWCSTVDSIVVFMYTGEGFQNAQTTKLHIYKNGQFYKIIGKTYAEASAIDGAETPREYAGNAFCGNLVKVNGVYYYFFNDEHGGSLHCFIINIPQ